LNRQDAKRNQGRIEELNRQDAKVAKRGKREGEEKIKKREEKRIKEIR
jgi:hypothetical protein